jgi:S-adenosylmethionine-diacylglycerol 3-amino-3-carboxypropyl transferase
LTDEIVTRVFFRGLVFNQSWEDPEVDRAGLRLNAGHDRVLSIASGGCNGLSLLCLRPRALTLIDLNPAQTHLVHLKLAGIRTLDHDDFYRLFGEGSPVGAERLYRDALRAALPEESRAYWDAHPAVLRAGLGVSGKLGSFLVWFRRFLHWRIGRDRLEAFFATETIESQSEYYWAEIAPRLWSDLTMRILGSRFALALAGMHPSQRNLVDSAQGVPRYLRERVEYVLTTLPLRDNYFAAQAGLGRYWDRRSCPPYLLEENLPVLREQLDTVTVVTGSVDDFARSLPAGSFDCLNLMDIFDWMTPAARSATFRSVLDAASGSARLLYRSTIVESELPAEFADRVVDERALADRLFARDRSFTYANIHLYRVRRDE